MAGARGQHDADATLAAFWSRLTLAPPWWRFLLADLPGAWRALRALVALPVLDWRPLGRRAEARPAADVAAVLQVLDHRFPLGIPGRWAGNAVLEIPADPASYLLGSHRQTLRRKVRAAQREGLRCREVPPEERPALLAIANASERSHPHAEYRQDAPDNDDLLALSVWIAVHDADDSPVLVAVVPIAGEWATLRYYRALGWEKRHSDARYLGMVALVEALAAHGVRHLVDSTPPPALGNGLRHFQRMVGFRYFRIRRRGRR